MNDRERTVLQGRLRHALDRQGFRCPFCTAALDLQWAILADIGPAVLAVHAYASHYAAAQVLRGEWSASQSGGTVLFSG